MVQSLKTEPPAYPFSGGEVGGKQGLHSEPNVFLVASSIYGSQISVLHQMYIMYVCMERVCIQHNECMDKIKNIAAL